MRNDFNPNPPPGWYEPSYPDDGGYSLAAWMYYPERYGLTKEDVIRIVAENKKRKEKPTMADIGNEPAFPMPPAAWSEAEGFVNGTRGMTYRQWLIGKALQGILANPDFSNKDFPSVSRMAIAHADETIKMLKQEGK